MTLELWAFIAKKLGISEDDAILVHAFNRDWVSLWGKRKTYAVVTGVVERFGLSDEPMDKSYAQQLLAKGILTPQEAALFSGEKIHAERLAEGEAAKEEIGTGSGADNDSLARNADDFELDKRPIGLISGGIVRNGGTC